MFFRGRFAHARFFEVGQHLADFQKDARKLVQAVGKDTAVSVDRLPYQLFFAEKVEFFFQFA